MNQKIEKIKLFDIINKYTEEGGVTEIEDNTDLVLDRGFSSLEFVSLIMEIESEFGIEFDVSDMDFEHIKIFKNLYEIVIKKVEKLN